MVQKKFELNAEAAMKNLINSNKKNKKNQELVHKGYYITTEQYKSLRKFAVEQDADMSSIVRDALEEYFLKYSK